MFDDGIKPRRWLPGLLIVPSPLAGEGQGEGDRESAHTVLTPILTFPRQGGRDFCRPLPLVGEGQGEGDRESAHTVLTPILTFPRQGGRDFCRLLPLVGEGQGEGDRESAHTVLTPILTFPRQGGRDKSNQCGKGLKFVGHTCRANFRKPFPAN